MHSLKEYRATLDRIGDGTVSVAFAREIIDAAEERLQQAAGELTIQRAMELSGKSRGWFMRRVPSWEKQGLARRVEGGPWLVREVVVPRRRHLPRGGIDPSLSDDEILRRLVG
jgi:hypothetical protein